MSRTPLSQRSRPTAVSNGDSISCSLYSSPPLAPHGGSVKLPMLSNSVETACNNTPRTASTPETQSVGRLSIENIHLTHQNGSLARELAHSRYTIHALRQIVSQKEAAEQRAQQDLKQSLWRVRVLEAVVGRMSEQLVLLMGEQRGGFEEGTDVVGLAREVAVGEFYRQHAALQQRELEAIRGELDDDDYDPEEEDYEDDNQQLDAVSTADSVQELNSKTNPPSPRITVTDSDADTDHPPTFDSDRSPSSSSSEDDDLEDYLEEGEEQFTTATAAARNIDPTTKIYDTEPPVVVEERPGLRADVLFARMRIVAGEV